MNYPKYNYNQKSKFKYKQIIQLMLKELIYVLIINGMH